MTGPTARDELTTVLGALAGVRIEIENHDWQDADCEWVEHLTRTVVRGQEAAAALAAARSEAPGELDAERLRCGNCGDDLLPSEVRGHLLAEGRVMDDDAERAFREARS